MWEENKKKYAAALGLTDQFEMKGKNMIYTSSNGYMFSMLNKAAEAGVRLSKEDKAAFHEKYTSDLYKSHGAVMKDYVLIPQELLEQPEELVQWFVKGFNYVNTLTPK